MKFAQRGLRRIAVVVVLMLAIMRRCMFVQHILQMPDPVRERALLRGHQQADANELQQGAHRSSAEVQSGNSYFALITTASVRR